MNHLQDIEKLEADLWKAADDLRANAHKSSEAVDQLKLTAYFERQADWLLSRFPDAEFTAVLGLCRAVPLAEIEAADWSLTPGRYVGVAPAEVDEDFDFEGHCAIFTPSWRTLIRRRQCWPRGFRRTSRGWGCERD